MKTFLLFMLMFVAVGTTRGQVLSGAFPATLPIALNELQVTLEKNCTQTLHWKVYDEFPGDYYDIQSSTDGIHFDFYKHIEPQGLNSGGTYDYSIPLSLAPDVNYLRVKISGSTYSKIVKINYSGCALVSKTAASIYPNPAQSSANLVIQYYAAADDLIDAVIFTISGSLAQQYSFRANTGSNLFTITANSLIPGTYYIRLTDKNHTATVLKQIIR